jgi:hypothetical protein
LNDDINYIIFLNIKDLHVRFKLIKDDDKAKIMQKLNIIINMINDNIIKYLIIPNEVNNSDEDN